MEALHIFFPLFDWYSVLYFYSGEDNHSSYVGRVILVKLGDYSRKIGIDGCSESIKEAIKAAFGLRTRRAFWLEDEDEVVRSLDRDMPLGTYTVHLDEGIVLNSFVQIILLFLL